MRQQRSMAFWLVMGLAAGTIGVACGGGESREPTDDDDGGGSGGSSKGGSGGSTSKGGSGGSSKGGSGGSTTGGTGGDGTAGNGAVNLEDGLVGHWKFDDNAMDSSGNDNHGEFRVGGVENAPVNMAPRFVEGVKGKALSFDGTTEWVTVPDSDSLDSTGLNNAVSVSAWVKFDKINDLKPWNFLVQRHEVGTRLEHFGLALLEGRPTARVHVFSASAPQNAPLGEWLHMAMTYDGTTERIYMNGSELAFLDIGWPIAADETPLTIGAAINEVDVIENVAGATDEIRLYNRALTVDEIKELAKK